ARRHLSDRRVELLLGRLVLHRIEGLARLVIAGGIGLQGQVRHLLVTLITDRMAAPKALLSPSPHFRVAATPPDGSSLLCGTQPVSSLAHDTPDPPSLQSKCWPWPGGAATAAPAATRKHPPMTDPR